MEKMGVKLHIELIDGDVYHYAGSNVKGHIFLEVVGKSILGKLLTLNLTGMEETEFGSSHLNCGRA